MALSPTSSRSSGSGGSALVDYVEWTTDVSVTATTSGTANVIVTADALNANGTAAYWIEWFSGFLTQGTANVSFQIGLYDGGVLVTGMAFIDIAVAKWAGPGMWRRKLTPTAGSHTYSARGWNGSAATSSAGGRTDTIVPPGYIAIYSA